KRSEALPKKVDGPCALDGCAAPSRTWKKKRNILPPRIPPPQLELLQRYLPPWTASLAILPWEDRDACSARGNLWSPVRLMSYPIACVAEYWKSCACFTQRDNGRLNLKSKFSCPR